jgi:hypothetical protein
MNNNGNGIQNNNNSNSNAAGSGNGVSWNPVKLSDMQQKEVAKSSGGVVNYRNSHGSTMLASANTQMPGMSALNQPVLIGKNANSSSGQKPTMSMMNDPFTAISLSSGPAKAPLMNYNLEVTSQLGSMPMMGNSNSSKSMISDFFVPSKVSLPGCLRETPPMFNELNSFLVSDSADVVLAALSQMLDSFQGDIDFTVDNKNYIVSGQVFIDNLGVSFKICIFQELDGTRCEVRRSCGSSVGFSNFYTTVEQAMGNTLKFVNGFESDSDLDSLGFPPLPLSMSLDSLGSLSAFGDCNGLPTLGYSDEDLSRFAQDLSEDSFQVETLGMIYDMERETILKSSELMAQITICTNSHDFAVKRLALKILTKVEAM